MNPPCKQHYHLQNPKLYIQVLLLCSQVLWLEQRLLYHCCPKSENSILIFRTGWPIKPCRRRDFCCYLLTFYQYTICMCSQIINSHWLLYIRNLKYAHITPVFLHTQYPLSILNLPTQMQMNIVHRKTSFKREFKISDVLI